MFDLYSQSRVNSVDIKLFGHAGQRGHLAGIWIASEFYAHFELLAFYIQKVRSPDPPLGSIKLGEFLQLKPDRRICSIKASSSDFNESSLYQTVWSY